MGHFESTVVIAVVIIGQIWIGSWFITAPSRVAET
jgi:hypothetical protein